MYASCVSFLRVVRRRLNQKEYNRNRYGDDEPFRKRQSEPAAGLGLVVVHAGIIERCREACKFGIKSS